MKRATKLYKVILPKPSLETRCDFSFNAESRIPKVAIMITV